MNDPPRVVRKRERSPHEAHEDRRVRRTRSALVGALFELVLEKRYAAVTIRDLLDRADVGRSTFYSHYRGKDDLLLRSFEGMLARLDERLNDDPPGAGRLAPVRELFEHVAASRRFHEALRRAHMLERLYRVGTECLSRTIEARLRRRADAGPMPAPVLARSLAGALFALLAWWLDGETPFGPDRMDQMFHALAAAG